MAAGACVVSGSLRSEHSGQAAMIASASMLEYPVGLQTMEYGLYFTFVQVVLVTAKTSVY